jgi:predicted outer membrane repeat protein
MLFLLALSLPASTIYVMESGRGSGTSWADATGNLSAALLGAKAGDEVWVCKGIYYPSFENNRSKSFIIPSGVAVLGGFAGHEKSAQERDFQANKTVLSGNIGAVNDQQDNSYTVVYMNNPNEATLLDGFIIADGNANGEGPAADRAKSGAGIYIDGSRCVAKPTIRNCTLQNNQARDGGAVYLNGRNGHCNPAFINCQFLNNRAELDGGAIFNDGSQGGEASPEMRHCVFINNQSNYGGAICNYGGKGQSSPVLQTCVFRSNEAFLRGGAIFNMDVEGVTKPKINDCQFVDNQAIAGKGIYTYSRPQEKEEGMPVTKMN